ncbi:hypothetical protein C8J57DRAFT_1580090 [Mycena rebaudengoi]|nr:hypothetical protein C8J57DRAFT_1580090 [Mycena rebaudengoi]
MASTYVYTILRKLPESFWGLESLDTYLRQRQTHKSVDEVQPHQNEDDDNPMEDSLADTPLMDSTATPHLALFRRMATALCAWTTATRSLLNGRLSRVSVPIRVSIVDLPKAPIPAIDADTLFRHWTTKAGWSKQIGEKIYDTIQKIDLDLSPGACHCEAGLMASFLIHSHLPSKDGDAEEKGKEQVVSEPTVLSGYDRGTRDRVAKKCCPLCRILAEVLEEKHGLRVTLPGQHTTFFPWVPPGWLQSKALQEMERRLFDIVSEMADDDISTTSDPDGDPDQRPPNTVGTRVMFERYLPRQ